MLVLVLVSCCFDMGHFGISFVLLA